MHMSALAPQLRNMLTQSALDYSKLSKMLTNSISITGKELIHTSYFSNEDICIW